MAASQGELVISGLLRLLGEPHSSVEGAAGRALLPHVKAVCVGSHGLDTLEAELGVSVCEKLELDWLGLAAAAQQAQRCLKCGTTLPSGTQQTLLRARGLFGLSIGCSAAS